MNQNLKKAWALGEATWMVLYFITNSALNVRAFCALSVDNA